MFFKLDLIGISNIFDNQIFQRHVLQNLQRFTKCEEHPLQYSQFRTCQLVY